jgi:hypothetical protein
MPRKRRIPQACIALAADGSRCGRYPKPGERLCSKHQPNAQPVGVIAQQDTDDLAVLLQRLTKDRDPQIRLRAIDLLLKHEERRSAKCPECERRAERDRLNVEFTRVLTDDERQQLVTVLAAYRDLQVVVYRRRSDVMPERFVMPSPPTPKAAAPDVAGSQPSAHVPEAETVTLTRVEDGAVIEEAISRAAFDAMSPEEIEP